MASVQILRYLFCARDEVFLFGYDLLQHWDRRLALPSVMELHNSIADMFACYFSSNVLLLLINNSSSLSSRV